MFNIFKSGSLQMKEDEAWSQVKYNIDPTWSLVSSAHETICKHFGARSGPTICRAWSGSKLFDNDGIP